MERQALQVGLSMQQKREKGGQKVDRNEELRHYLRKNMDQSNVSRDVGPSFLNASGNESTSKPLQQMKIQKRRDHAKQAAAPNYNQQFQTIQNSSISKKVRSNLISPDKVAKSRVPKKNQHSENYSFKISDSKQRAGNMGQDHQHQFQAIEDEEERKNLILKTRGRNQGRSQTSHKIRRPQPNHLQRNHDLPLDQNADHVNTTIAQEDPQMAVKTMNNETRNHQRCQEEASHNQRASITREVTTKSVIDQQTKKVDNCVSKFAFATKTGFSPNNPFKVNQDSFLAVPHLGEYRRTHFFAVCDGHGQNGKDISEHVKTVLGQKVEVQIKQIFDKAKQLQRVVDSSEVKDSLALSFSQVSQSLLLNSGIDTYFSGSTCVAVLIVGNKVFCANVGDSRAVITREVNNVFQAYPLNRDHKADEPDEEERIIANGGRIDAFRDINGRPMGPMRVWQMHENIPGLAMSRSFGDGAAAEVGVIPDAEIFEMNLTDQDKFIVIASDGVWEFLTNEEVTSIVKPYYLTNSAEKAAEALIKEALKRWKQQENVVDDITCIIIFLSIS